MANIDGYEMEKLMEMEAPIGSAGDTWEIIVKYSGDIERVAAELNVEAEPLGEGLAILTLESGQMSLLYNYKAIEYIEIPKTLSLSLYQSMDAACVTAAQSPEGYGLTGRDVLIGIIDSGIDYTHPDFRNPDGTSRILFLWDQTLEGTPPAGFRQGAEFDNRAINEALSGPRPLEAVPSEDFIGHGTAVAGIAAGNGRASGGREGGAAPEALLIVVKLGFKGYESFARTTEVMRGLKYILDKAEALSMPVAVNLSYGSNDGSHDGSSLFEFYMNAAALRWKSVIVAASGNEGAAGHHFSGDIGQGETMNVQCMVSKRLPSFYLTMWKHFSDTTTVELILPGGSASVLIDPSKRFTEKRQNGVHIRVYYGQPTHYSEDQEIFFRVDEDLSPIPRGPWTLRIRGVNILDGRFDIWLPTLEEVGEGVNFTEPDPEITLTLPSTAANVISVGGYNSALDTAAPFSGRGFTRNMVYPKPDLTAPAVGIISVRAGGGYDSFTGTSMAAPFVTGAAALMLQWGIALGNDPFLYGQRVKAFLKKGARRNGRANYPSPIWGYGILCLKDVMDLLSRG